MPDKGLPALHHRRFRLILRKSSVQGENERQSDRRVCAGKPDSAGCQRTIKMSGRIRRDETPLEAARRELVEETTLVADELRYLFQFTGFNTLHHVFFAGITHHARVQPSNEIVKCRWFAPVKIAALSASIPTR
jgi:NADH pyrophosphatase NudC (nudix superfamily)